MAAPEKIHQQSRWELVGLILTGLLILGTSVALFAWAATTPTTDPRNEPRPGVTEFAVHPYSA